MSDHIPLLRQGVINDSQISEFLTDDPNAAKLTVTVADPNVELRLNNQAWNIGGKGTQILPLKPGRYQFLGFVGNVKQIDQAITLKAGDQRSLFFERPRARQSESLDGRALSFPPGSSADLLTSRDHEWTEPENLGPLVNTEYIERNPTLSSDGLTLIFESDRPGGPQPTVEFMPEFNLWQTTRANLDAPWTQPVILSPPVNSAGFDKSPSLSADGLTLLFDSSRAGRTDIWMTTRRSLTGEWTTPLNLREQLDTKGMLDQHPTLSADGLTLFFGSTSVEPPADDFLDLWMSTRKSEQDSWSKAIRLGPGINSRFRENDPMLAADGLSLLLTHGLPHEVPHLHVSTRPDLHSPWSKPIPLSRRIDPDSLVFGADFSLPHRTLIFTSARENGEGNFDLWMSRVVSKLTDGRRSENQLATNLPVTSAELLTSDEYEWSEPENLGPLVNTEDEESSPTLTSDGLLMTFARTHIVDPSIDSVRGSLWQSTRTNLNEPWSKPMELSSFINSSNSEMTPCLAGDGLTLFFSSAREGGE
ncbi:MAG TPA: hypothetical protein VLA12_08655, partial [Planctomycetaceae bacterium]|nr:hypothetical protein [Planctomycetaceae bacterium]